MKQANVIRVAVNPSNLILPVKINDKVFKKNLHNQPSGEKNDVMAIIREEEAEMKRFFQNSTLSMSSLMSDSAFKDRSFIKSLVPRNRIYKPIISSHKQ